MANAPRLNTMLKRLQGQAAVDLIAADLTFARRLALNRKTWIRFQYTNENGLVYTISNFHTNQELKRIAIGGIRFGAGWSLNSGTFRNGVCFDPQGLPTDLSGQPLGEKFFYNGMARCAKGSGYTGPPG